MFLPLILTPQLLTRVLLLALLALVALPVVGEWAQGHTGRWPAQLLSLLASALLLWLLDAGYPTAWRVTVSMSILLGFVAFALSLVVGQWTLTLAGLMFMGIGLTLVGYGPVRAYLNGRWAARGVVIPTDPQEQP